MRRLLVAIALLLLTAPAQAATYYISPSGSDLNNGTSPATPWQSFSYAINSARAWCGDTLRLLSGTYGDDGGTTGKISLNGVVCTLGDELTIRAEDQRQAKILDNGTGYAARIQNSAYIIVDGIYFRSTDNSASTGGTGRTFQIDSSSNITVRNSLFANPNRYGNTPSTGAYFSTDILFEDNESYIFHRHCFTAWHSERVVVRRQYCNPRGGAQPGHVGAGNGINRADALISMYPCKDCILENGIGDGTGSRMYLFEMNGTLGSGIVLSGSKILGSICYKCDYGNGGFPNARSPGINYSPQNITVEDVAFVDHNSGANGIRCSNCVNVNFNHLSILGTGTGLNGFVADDTADGATAAEGSVNIRNSIVTGKTQYGFRCSGPLVCGGSYLTAFSNTTNFSTGTWTNTLTTDPALGTCKLWPPDASVSKTNGDGGTYRGAQILYRYVNGVLTSTPLWDPVTGAFPNGAADPDGLNRVAGQSLFDFHTRVNVNTGGCNFPAGYGGGGGASTVVRGTTADSGLSTTASPLVWTHTIAANQDLLLVCVGKWHSGANVGSVVSIDVSGQAMTFVAGQVTIPDFYRSVELWKLANPTSGTRTITVTLAGNISGVVGRSTEFDVTSGTNTAVGASTSGAATSLSVTAPTNTNERVEDCTVSSKSVTYTHGADQTGDPHLDHSTQSLRLATSTQNGSSGGVMSNSTGGTVLQAKVAVSLIAGTPDPPSSATLTLDKFLIRELRGAEAKTGAKPLMASTPITDIDAAIAAATNVSGFVGSTGAYRVRMQITGGVATTAPFGVALYCRKNADARTRVLDTFNGMAFRLYGAGPDEDADIPPSLTKTTDQLCSSNCVPGAVIRDQASFTVPALTVGQKIELEWAVEVQAAVGDTIACFPHRDDGSVLNVESVTPTVTIADNRSTVGS